MKRRGFTLIELLVVIAIIAILAAILFPVFAQAKLAAKVTALLSNTKETGTAAFLYANDADDSLPLGMDGTGSNGWTTWQMTMQPYIKNWGILYSPLYPQPSGNMAYWQQLLYFGSMLRIADLPIGATQQYYSINNPFNNNNPTLFDGVLGSGGTFYATVATGAPSISLTQADHPAGTALFTPSGQWDYWAGVFGSAPLGFCSSWGTGWSPYGSEWVFAGPISSKPLTASGIGPNCNYPDGKVLYVALDGSAHTEDYWGGLFHSTLEQNGTWVFDKYWLGGL